MGALFYLPNFGFASYNQSMGRRFYFRIAIMLAALYAIVSIIKNLNAEVIEDKAKDPSSILSVLIGSELRPMNWCPPDLMYIQDMDKKVIANKPDQFATFCEIMTSPATKETPSTQRKAVLLAVGRDSQVVLEWSTAKNFSVKGLPFQSTYLLQKLHENGLRLE